MTIIDPKFPNIFSLARIQISLPEKQLLSKGLKFCPTPRKVDTSENEKAIGELTRKIHMNAIITKPDREPTGNLNLDDEFIKRHKSK